jgi:hypothetical protein
VRHRTRHKQCDVAFDGTERENRVDAVIGDELRKVFHKQKQKPDLVNYQRVTFQKPFSQRERRCLNLTARRTARIAPKKIGWKIKKLLTRGFLI